MKPTSIHPSPHPRRAATTRRRTIRAALFSFPQLLAIIAVAPALVVLAGSDSAARDEAKPFYLRDIKVGGITIPISPVTVAITIVSLFVLLRGVFGSSSKVTASHILVEGPDAEARLAKMKAEIGSDPAKFAALAGKHSKCPSGKAAGGKLGTFSPGSMVPPFDKAAFDPKNKVGDVVGPIQTNFGWHLILIVNRVLAE